MDPVTITITDDYELAGVLRIRCHMRAGEIENLVTGGKLDDVIDNAEREVDVMEQLLERLETAKAALEAIRAE